MSHTIKMEMSSRDWAHDHARIARKTRSASALRDVIQYELDSYMEEDTMQQYPIINTTLHHTPVYTKESNTMHSNNSNNTMPIISTTEEENTMSYINSTKYWYWPLYTKENTMRPIHRAYMLGTIISTIITIMGYVLYTHTTMGDASHTYTFIMQWMGVLSTVACACMYHIHRTSYQGEL